MLGKRKFPENGTQIILNKKRKIQTAPVAKNALMQLNEIKPGLEFQFVSQSGLPVSSTKLSQSNVESRATPIQSNVIWPYYPQTASGNCKDFHFDALYSRIFLNLKMITMILLVLYHHVMRLICCKK